MSNTQPTLETVDRERSIAMRIILSAPVVALFAIWSMQSVRATLRDYVEVSGFVTLNGDPLPRAIVTLHPRDTSAASGILPSGNTSATGKFSLRIPIPASTKAPQRYIATVVCKPLVVEGEAIVPAIDAVPARYGRPETSPLKLELGSDVRFLSIRLIAHDHGQVVSGRGGNDFALLR